MYYTKVDTSLCAIILAGDENGLTDLHLETGEGKRTFTISEDWIFNNEFFEDATKQIKEYFDGARKGFSIRLNPKGTEFQKKVWAELRKIPYGKLCSYKDIAVRIGNEKASRAVGMAAGRNPLPLVTPCHRVVGSNGKLTGFAGGLAIKEKLIDLERTHLGSINP